MAVLTSSENTSPLGTAFVSAVIAIGGSYGTLSEIALALRIGTPVVGLHDRFAGVVDIPRVSDPAAAVAWARARAARVPEQ